MFGIGIGNVTPPVRTLNTSLDDAFVLSGRSLDDLNNSDNRLKIESSNDKANGAFRVISYFLDYILSQLTTKQAAVLFELLMGRTQTEAAKKLRKSQVTINKQVHAAGWLEIERLLLEFKHTIYQFNLK